LKVYLLDCVLLNLFIKIIYLFKQTVIEIKIKIKLIEYIKGEKNILCKTTHIKSIIWFFSSKNKLHLYKK
jgi:hypothetical protein